MNMGSKEVKQRARQFDEFGDLLLKRFSHASATGRPVDESAKRLGRYLRAARTNAGLSPAELAARSQLPLATILALEIGLIPAQEIDLDRLRQLAKALAEDIDDLMLLLRPRTRKQGRFSWRKDLKWRRPVLVKLPQLPMAANLLAQPHLPLKSIYTTCLGLLICLVTFGVWQQSWPPLKPSLAPEIQTGQSYFSQIEPKTRLSLIKAESSLRNTIWLQENEFPRVDTDAFLTVATLDFDTKPPFRNSSVSYTGPTQPPGRLNMIQAEHQLKIAALVQPAYLPVQVTASCCGLQP